MHIGIDIQWLKTNQAGVGTYIFNLVRHLLKVDHENQYFLYSPEKSFSQKIILDMYRSLWTQIFLPLAIKKDKIDLFHSPCYFMPVFLSGRLRSIVTVHDMSSWIYPEKFNLKHRLVYSTLVPYSLKKADRIIAVSNNTKTDVSRLFKIKEEKIDVIYEAAEEVFQPIKEENLAMEIGAKYGIDGEYMLFVGTLEPRKNLFRLIRAFASLKKQEKIYEKLVIAGKPGWLYKDIFNLVKELKLEKEIIFTGHVVRKDLVSLYNVAKIFVYPSLYEGFGLPVLEAMACGTPVVTSNVSSLPEIAGDSAVLVNPYEIEELAGAMFSLLRNGKLRKKFSEKGLERAKLFSWDKTAIKTLEAYQRK